MCIYKWIHCIVRIDLWQYGCFLKWWYPQNTPKWSFLVGKTMVVGYRHFRKPPYSTLVFVFDFCSGKAMVFQEISWMVEGFRSQDGSLGLRKGPGPPTRRMNRQTVRSKWQPNGQEAVLSSWWKNWKKWCSLGSYDFQVATAQPLFMHIARGYPPSSHVAFLTP